MNTSSGARVNDSIALTVPVVNACVGLRSDMVAGVPCKLMRKTSDNTREEVTDSPVSPLISFSPNGHHTSFELFRFLETGASMGGNGYGRVYRDKYYEPGEIQPLLPCDVRPEKLANGRVGYLINGEKGIFSRADILHWYGNSLDMVRGLSPIRQAGESIGLSISQRGQAGSVAKNGARPSFAVSTDQPVAPEKLKDMSASFSSQFSGPENAGKIPFFSNNLKPFALQGMTMADAEFLESRKFERSEIAMIFRVPEVLIGSTDKTSSWGTGIEQLMLGFLNFTLNPLLTNYEKSLAITLLSQDQIAKGYYFKFNRGAFLQAAIQAQAQFYDVMRKIGVFSVNDVRRLLDMNDLPDHLGDNYQLPFNAQGGVAAANQPAGAGAKGADE